MICHVSSPNPSTEIAWRGPSAPLDAGSVNQGATRGPCGNLARTVRDATLKIVMRTSITLLL